MPVGIAISISTTLSQESSTPGGSVSNFIQQDNFNFVQQDGVSVFLEN